MKFSGTGNSLGFVAFSIMCESAESTGGVGKESKDLDVGRRAAIGKRVRVVKHDDEAAVLAAVLRRVQHLPSIRIHVETDPHAVVFAFQLLNGGMVELDKGTDGGNGQRFVHEVFLKG